MTPTQLATRYCANSGTEFAQVARRIRTAINLVFAQRAHVAFSLEKNHVGVVISKNSSCRWQAGPGRIREKSAEFKNAVHTYRICIVGEKGSNATIRRCPDCQQNTIGPRQRYCDECKARRRTETQGTAKKKWRVKNGLMSNS